MTQVVAQGTFDILHPGHVHYLREARAMGDRLTVILARNPNVTHKPDPVVPARQRVAMVEALEPVDDSRLGHPEDIFVPIEEIDPDIIVLGHDQHHDEDQIEAALDSRGIGCAVERASRRPRQFEDELLSSGTIVERIIDQRA